MTPVAPIRMLLIDDEDSVAAALSHQFRHHAGWAVDIATDALSASAHMAAQFYDVILLDIALTGPTIAEGLALVALARTHQSRSRILVFTAFDSHSVRCDAMRHGANAIIHKPAASEDVRSAVYDLLSGD